MNKLMLELYLPASGQVFDVKIPRQISVYQATQMLICMLEEMDTGEYVPDMKTVLCNRETGIPYNINISIDSLGLHNGSRIMLI